MPTRFSRWSALVAVGLMLLVHSGCSKKGGLAPLADVTGTITLDGQPAPGVLVEFNPQLTPLVASSGANQGKPPVAGSTGLTNAEGKFSLQYDKQRAGAVLGSHVVRVSKLPAYDPEDKPAAPDPIPPQYNIASTITFDVKEGPNTYNLDVKTR